MSAVFRGILGCKVSIGRRDRPGQPATDLREATLRGVKWTARHPLYLVELTDGQLEVVDPTRFHVVFVVRPPPTREAELVQLPASDLTPVGEPWDCASVVIPLYPESLRAGVSTGEVIDFHPDGVGWKAVHVRSGRALGVIESYVLPGHSQSGWLVYPGRPLPGSHYLCATSNEVIRCLVVDRFVR